MCANCLALSRRALLGGSAAAAATLATGVAQARIPPSSMVPLIGPGYRPTDKDEQGMWHEMERAEQEILPDLALSYHVRPPLSPLGWY